MAFPQLTFFCELEAGSLADLFTDAVLDSLLAMKARLSLGLLDLSQERAAVVRRLNQAGIPVTAWLLLSRDQGYWCNSDNASDAAACYAAFKVWTQEHGLHWSGVGLDIEPDIGEMETLAANPLALLPRLLRRVFDRRRVASAQSAYEDLADQIRVDGYRVESYQFPVIEDERKAGSTLLRRLSGMVDLPVDREIWMLYTSFVRPYGAGILASYGPEAQAIALGSTGGGVELSPAASHPLGWDELARDLRLAYVWTDHIYIFSLEGCLRQGFLEKLKIFIWDQPILLPEKQTEQVNSWRRSLQSILWVSANLNALLVGAVGALVLVQWLRRFLLRKERSGSDA